MDSPDGSISNYNTLISEQRETQFDELVSLTKIDSFRAYARDYCRMPEVDCAHTLLKSMQSRETGRRLAELR